MATIKKVSHLGKAVKADVELQGLLVPGDEVVHCHRLGVRQRGRAAVVLVTPVPGGITVRV